jgi:hypothetical protein
MPVSFLSSTQRERYGHYAGDPSADELARYFHLDDADRAAIGGKRGEHNRLGYAVQLTTVRFVGTFLEDLATVPAGVVQTLRRQLGLNGPELALEITLMTEPLVPFAHVLCANGSTDNTLALYPPPPPNERLLFAA